MTPEDEKSVKEFQTAVNKLKWSRDQLQIVRMDPIDCEVLIREMYRQHQRLEQYKKPNWPIKLIAFLNLAIIIYITLTWGKEWIRAWFLSSH